MKAAIFDFDGTIADSAYVWESVDNNFFKKRGMSVPSDYTQKISTLNMYDGAVFTKTAYNIKDEVEDIIKEWQTGALSEYRTNVCLKPCAADYIRQLKASGIKIGLATAASPEFYTPVLKKNNLLGLFDAFSDGTSGVKSKDTPEIFLHCAAQLNVKPEDCEVYEDILPAIISAATAKMRTVAVYEKRSDKDWHKIKAAADKSILSFGELLK